MTSKPKEQRCGGNMHMHSFVPNFEDQPPLLIRKGEVAQLSMIDE